MKYNFDTNVDINFPLLVILLKQMGENELNEVGFLW